MKTTNPDLLTKQQLADFLNVNKTTIYNYTVKGIIKGYRLPGSNRIYYKKSEVESKFKETV